MEYPDKDAVHVARAWVVMLLNDTPEELEEASEVFHDFVLSPFMKKYGAPGGFALCQALAELAAGYVDVAVDTSGLSTNEIIETQMRNFNPLMTGDYNDN